MAGDGSKLLLPPPGPVAPPPPLSWARERETGQASTIIQGKRETTDEQAEVSDQAQGLEPTLPTCRSRVALASLPLSFTQKTAGHEKHNTDVIVNRGRWHT